MYEDYYAVIMAGGSGTRLWPLSRADRPKQTLAIGGTRTLFQRAVDRLEGLFPMERILIVTIADQASMLQEQCPDIPTENYIIEPLPRGTASVVGLAAIAIKNRNPQGSMAILTADHLIRNDAHLRQLLRAAYAIAQEDYLVTLGITPGFPATGYGYIQKRDLLAEYEGLKIYGVEKFKEKPDHDLAVRLIGDGQHVWNSGMFVWKVDAVIAEFERQMPELQQKLESIDRVWGSDQYISTVESVWSTITPQTIDYGVMDHAEKVAVIPSVDLDWNDVGSWDSLFDALEADENGNLCLHPDPILFDTQGTLIYGDSDDRLIVTIGVENLIIVESGNAILVCDRNQAQRVREVIDHLKANGREEYL